MKEEWLMPGAVVPVDVETTAALINEITQLIEVVGAMALLRRDWVGLTDEEVIAASAAATYMDDLDAWEFARAIEAKLKEKNA